MNQENPCNSGKLEDENVIILERTKIDLKLQKKKSKKSKESMGGPTRLTDSYLNTMKQASKGRKENNMVENHSNYDNKKLMEMFSSSKKIEKKPCWAMLCC